MLDIILNKVRSRE